MKERPHNHWAWITQGVPMLGVGLAFVLAFSHGIGWMEIIAFLSMFALGTIGIEIGLHRYFSHKSFRANKPMSVMLAILASVGAMGPVFYWAHYHRRHHQHSDTEKDPHSPNDVYAGGDGLLKRLLFAHLGWGWRGWDPPRGSLEVSKDLSRFTGSQAVLWVVRRYIYWVLLGILLPATVCGLWQGTWYGFLSGALWGGFVRIAVGQHSVWGTNSIGHRFGCRHFDTNDRSTNSQYIYLLFSLIGAAMIYLNTAEPVKIVGSMVFVFVFAFITIGAGWHNNHHAFPNCAVQQHSWWQIDPLGWLILLWQKLGLVSGVTRLSTVEVKNPKNSDTTLS
jgi:stearoyl-CoA desaturase (delta-9 desaturase)